MKKAIISSIILLFLSINVLSIYAQSPPSVETITPIPDPKNVNYNLAYPGILPDHPLYKLKVLRDKITEKLINDPAKKIDFYLLQTDKQILASSMLVEKHKIGLAKETALKGENNYTMIVNEYRISNKKPNKATFEKLKKASLKHQEVLRIIINRMGKNDKITFENVLYFSKTNLEELNKMQNNK